MTTALGVDVDTNGNGVDPLTHRQIIKRHWNNTGIMGGLTVSGRSDLYYTVSTGVAVCSMGDADGYTEAYWPGGKTENTVSAGDGTYARIDSVYLLANTGTPDNDVHCLALQGTPSASPVAPKLPAGALLLRNVTIPAGASTTGVGSIGVDVRYAIPYGASGDLLGAFTNTADAFGSSTVREWYTQESVSIYVPTDRTVEIIYQATFANAHQDRGRDLVGGGWISWGVAALLLDGVAIPHSGTEWQASNGVWESHEIHKLVKVTAGRHTIAVRNGLMSHQESSGMPYFRYSDNGGVSYKGRDLQVWDRGPDQ
ncbi:hypothetical protein [Bifidobacterium mongoliense]|uniref:Uncharacterized protein n=1 Tax=Bifidobacterium mongoliense DSM 21395 TaxID=1437603 RepID=A0A087CAF5_9BIFI|nr:hypothetical protein [Bifidobacterium mongoliense]KFI80255.1 hypothetical protein BMON_0127 [Bifidobacterium mongoliense DSM 21395]